MPIIYIRLTFIIYVSLFTHLHHCYSRTFVLMWWSHLVVLSPSPSSHSGAVTVFILVLTWWYHPHFCPCMVMPSASSPLSSCGGVVPVPILTVVFTWWCHPVSALILVWWCHSHPSPLTWWCCPCPRCHPLSCVVVPSLPSCSAVSVSVLVLMWWRQPGPYPCPILVWWLLSLSPFSSLHGGVVTILGLMQ
jgi:hypothetical protein